MQKYRKPENYIQLANTSPEAFPSHLSKLKILDKLFYENCNIGAEGRLSVFLAITINSEEDKKAVLENVINEDGSIKIEDTRLVLLSIFVSSHEDLSLELISILPKIETEAKELFYEIMQALKELYIKTSIIESSKGLRH